MDDDSLTGALEGVCAGSPRKRPRPSASGVANDYFSFDGDCDGDGSSNDEPASRRQRSSLPRLSLLAKCAKLVNNSADSSLLRDQNQQFQFPPDSLAVGGATRHPSQNSTNNNINNIPQLQGNSSLPAGISIQNTVPVPGYVTNPHLSQGLVSMQPNILASQYLASLQAPPAFANPGSLLCPFGMTPQELLNYAVMINAVQNSAAQASNGILAFNVAQAMVPPHGAIQAVTNSVANHSTSVATGGAAQNTLEGAHQPEGKENEQLAKSNQSNETARNNEVQAGRTSGDGFYGAGEPTMETRACNDDRNVRRKHGKSFDASTHSVSYRNDIATTLPTTKRRTQQELQAPQNARSMRCVPLWTSEDEGRLSTQQCWLRKQIETFPASARNVRTRGRNRLLDVGQLGIQCIHCKNLPQEGRGTGSSYFPAAIKSIYQSAQNMLTAHFKEDTCPLIPRRVLQQMKDAGEDSVDCPRMVPRAGKSRAGGGKYFWIAAAKNITGLVDTTVGIRYANDGQNYQSLDSIALGTSGGHMEMIETDSFPTAALTRIEDKEKVTDFCYILMSQFFPKYASTPSSGWNSEMDSDIENEESVPAIGLCCKFCKGKSLDGKQSKGIFLSSKADTMMRNKNMARMFSHLMVCAPEDIKTKLIRAKNIHLPQSDRLKKGWKKRFFEKVCDRMHESL